MKICQRISSAKNISFSFLIRKSAANNNMADQQHPNKHKIAYAHVALVIYLNQPVNYTNRGNFGFSKFNDHVASRSASMHANIISTNQYVQLPSIILQQNTGQQTWEMPFNTTRKTTSIQTSMPRDQKDREVSQCIYQLTLAREISILIKWPDVSPCMCCSMVAL